MHTLTGDSSIFIVGTVVDAKWVTGTVHESRLIPSTPQLVQKNGSSSPTKVSTRPGNCTCGDKFTEWRRTQTECYMQFIGGLTTSSVSTANQSQFCLAIVCMQYVPMYLLVRIPAACMQRLHQMCSRSHHTQCPMHYCCRFPLDPRNGLYHLEAWCLR